MANMQELTWMEKNNLTPGKVGLIGTLAVVFLGVVAYQLAPIFFRGTPAPPPADQANGRPRPNAPVARSNADVPPPPPHMTKQTPTRGPTRTNVTWPQISLAKAIKHDPFRIPGSLREAIFRQRKLASQGAAPAAETVDEQLTRREAFLTTLTERGVDVIIFDGDNNAIAAIGELELRVGDVVEGLQVKSISRDGIELVRVDPQARHGEP